ncbi:MAG: ABC transporter permease, partial [Spirochaetaceae bacterium]|nr:ABC transporter permease [Spirochaetaceae bacterium]
KLNQQLGFDRPFLVRYANYILDALRGDFGRSYITNKPVFNEIFARFPTTLTLAFLGTFVSVIIGIPLGILSAVKQYSALDIASTMIAMVMGSIPGFWFGMLMILFFSLKLGWLPSYGVGGIEHFVMPALTMGVTSAAHKLRTTRATMLETIREDYIRTARAKGAPEKVVIWTHALRNALLPIITLVGIDFAALLGGTILTESVFAMPGLGMLMLTSIRMKDLPLVMAATVFLATLFCISMLAVDILYAYVDPRLRSRYVGAGRAPSAGQAARG